MSAGTLPAHRVVQPAVPAAGYAVFQQGTAVMHRASAVTRGDERTTFVNSYIALKAGAFGGAERLAQAYNSVDPLHVLLPDWSRFRAFLAQQLLVDGEAEGVGCGGIVAALTINSPR